MNKLILSIAILSFTLSIEAQAVKKRDVPPAVVSMVATLYPDASKIKWEMEDGMYEATFLSAKTETSLVLSREGELVITETEIEVSALPEGVLAEIAQRHSTIAMIKEVTKITDIFGAVKYEVAVDEMYYMFDSNGEYLGRDLEDERDN